MDLQYPPASRSPLQPSAVPLRVGLLREISPHSRNFCPSAPPSLLPVAAAQRPLLRPTRAIPSPRPRRRCWGGRGGGGRGSSVYPAAVVYPHHSRQISWKPRVFLYQHFLSNAEANHLVSLARAELKRSAVADNMSGKSTLSDVRTSSGTFISKAKDPIVAGIEDKIAAWTFLPKGVYR